MDLKRKDIESCGSSVTWDGYQKKKKHKSDDDNASLGFDGITVPSSSSSSSSSSASSTTPSSSTATSSPPYWKHFLKYKKKFHLLCPSSSSPVNQASCQITAPQFHNKEYQESYSALKSREIQLFNQNYTNGLYSLNTSHLVLKQRYLIVDWMVDVSMVHYETTFLAVTLLDSVLAKGFFNSETLLQLLGVACLVLASRIEENREENEMIEQDRFHVEDNTFSKSEIIGMEWLVLNVLNFKCSVPTIYNFLGFYLRAVNADDDLEIEATNLGLMSLLDTERLCYSPSIVAAALVILASIQSSQESSCQQMLTMTGDVQNCVKSLGKWLKDYKK